MDNSTQREPNARHHFIRAAALVVMLLAGAGCSGTSPPSYGPAFTDPPSPPESRPVDPASLTSTQKQAAEAATLELQWTAHSRADLISTLTSGTEAYSLEDAVQAVDSLGEDWIAQAGAAAQSYLESGAFSRQGLIDLLTSPFGGWFTLNEATQGVDALTVDWTAEASEYVTAVPNRATRSRQGLFSELTKQGGFTETQAAAGIDALDIDWDANAIRYARQLLEEKWMSPAALQTAMTEVDDFDNGGFTDEQTTNALNTVNIDSDANTRSYITTVLETSTVSRAELLREMTSDVGVAPRAEGDRLGGGRFTEAAVNKAIDELNPDWDAEALEAAEAWVDNEGRESKENRTHEYRCSLLILSLTGDGPDGGFTDEQAQTAGEKVGLCED